MAFGALRDARFAAGAAVFFASYLVFAFGRFPGLKINRAGMAMIGAVLMVALGVVGRSEALAAIDFGTIVLLFAMMLIVANLHLAGLLDLAAEVIVERLGSEHVLAAVVLSTGLLSAFFVNDVICLVMAPIVLKVAKRLEADPKGLLLAVATAANIGSVATITGNPQNMLIGSYSGLSYRSFLSALGPVAAGGLVIDWLILRWLFPPAAGRRRSAPRPLPSPSVRRGVLKPILVAGGVIAGFLAGLPPSLVAAVGAALVLLSPSTPSHVLYDQVDWSLLVFFIGLFIIVGGAERVGITGGLLALARAWNLGRPVVFAAATAAISNVVSNVPAVMLLKAVVPTFAAPRRAWLLLSLASTLAGNLTITGSIANIIVVERARGEAEIGFADYARVGIPVTLATLAFGLGWLSLAGA